MPTAIAALAAAVSLPEGAAAAEVARNDGLSWPTLHGEGTRCGFYPGFPEPPLEVVWRHALHAELTGPRAEVIVAAGVAIMGTYAGNLYAWDPATGEERWVLRTGSPIGHSVAVDGGVVYFAGMDGIARALRATTGEVVWERALGSGCWVAPLVHDGCVYLGTRDGVFHALDAATGAGRWSFQTGDRILTSASADRAGGHVVTASEDMHVYCFRAADGSLAWKSRKLPGLTLRDYAPLVAEGVAVVTTSPVRGFHETLNKHESFLLERVGFGGDFSSDGRRYVAGTSDDVRLEQEAILRYLKDNPSEQTLFAFRLADGSEPWVAPVLYTAGLHNPPSPPCHDPSTGESFVFHRSAYTVWDGGGEVRSLSGVARMDLATGRVDPIVHGYPSKEPGRPPGRKDTPWMTFNTIGDETQALSCSPRWLFSNHQGYLGSLDRENGLTQNFLGKRDTYLGFYGPGNFGWESDGGLEKAEAAGEPFGILNEWHGPARSIASVAGDLVYFNVGSQVICARSKGRE